MNNILSDFIVKLSRRIQALENWEMSEALEQIRSTYFYMLSFLIKGVNDPNAEELQQQLWQKAKSLQLRVERYTRLKDYPNNRYSRAVKALRSDSELGNLLMRFEAADTVEENEECMVKLFYRVWTSDQWQNADYEQASQLLFSEVLSPKAKAVLVSAIILALLEYFDEKKLMLLLDAYLMDNDESAQRALVGIVLSLRKDYELLEYYPEVAKRLEILSDDEIFAQHIYTILMQLQMSTQTDQVSSKIREDIMPSIVKGSSLTKRKMGMLEINDRMSENGENPEWLHPDELADSKAEEKIREMTEMQLEGEDVYMATFSMLKGYKFFNELPHWFYPFTTDDPSLQSIQTNFEGRGGRFMKALLGNSPFCNSDKYSLCFLTTTLGQQSFNAIASQMEAQLADMDEDEKEALLNKAINSKKRTKDYSREFIFDLYRFYYVYAFRSEFYNPFQDAKKDVFSPFNIRPLNALTDNLPLLLEHADFLMRKGYYDDALRAFDHYESEGQHTAELFQKIGFCYQKGDYWKMAKENYVRADSIKPDSKWTLAHLARVSTKLADYQTACDCYEQICDMEPENPTYLYRLADSYLSLHRPSEAIETLYKANYLQADSAKIRRLLAQALIINVEYEKALTYLDDPLTKGLTYILLNNPTEAYTHLRKAYESAKAPDLFFQAFYIEAQFFYRNTDLTPQLAGLYYDAVVFNVMN